jgi:hypothetical protein
MLYARLLGVLRSSAVARQHPDDTSNSPSAPSAPWNSPIHCVRWSMQSERHHTVSYVTAAHHRN